MTFTRTDALDITKICSGLTLVVAGTVACNSGIKSFDMTKRIVWKDVQMLGCGVLTIGFALATAGLVTKVMKRHI
jgi:hypothetical protein